MPDNSSGQFQRLQDWSADATNFVPMSPERMDTDADDMAAAIRARQLQEANLATAITSQVNAAVQSIVGSAPDALNTLQEIAAQLASDESATAAIIAAMTAKAPLASPSLTGTPTAPTPATSDSSTQIATTAYVQKNLMAAGASTPGTETPLVDGTATVGTSAKWAHEDHVHPTDTSRAAASALTAHASDMANPHNVTKSQVGLGSVNNTADADKPVSTATQTALDGKQAGSANLSSWSGIAPSSKADATALAGKQDASANLAAWSGIAPSSKADASALAGYAALAGATFTGYVYAPALRSTGQSNFQGNQEGTIAQAATTGYGSGSLMVQGPGAAGGAYMSFHRPGAYAACFGLDTDNYWKVGGWSMGTNSYKIFHEGNPPPQSYVGGRITGSTGAILSSSGVASVTRAGGGAYTVTLSAARASVNYAVIATARHAGGWLSVMEADAGEYTKTTTSFRLKVGSDTLGAVDPNQLSFVVLGG